MPTNKSITKEEKKEQKLQVKAENKEYRKRAFRNTLASTSKQLLWMFSINGVLWIWCSYVLAFMDKVQIAESLSSNVCTVVLGQIGFYLISKTTENIFKYNEFKWKHKVENIAENITQETTSTTNTSSSDSPVATPDPPTIPGEPEPVIY